MHGKTKKEQDADRRVFLQKLNKSLGHAAIRPAEKHVNPSYLRYPTGLMQLDLDLGGGFPAGGLSLVGGPYGVGKTRLLHRMARMHQMLYGAQSSILYGVTEFAPDHMYMRKCGVDVTVPDETIEQEQTARKNNRQPLLTKEEIKGLKTQTGTVDTLCTKNGAKLLDTIIDAYEAKVYGLIFLDSISMAQSPEELKAEGIEDTVKRSAHATMCTTFSKKFLAASVSGENRTGVIFTTQVRAKDKSKIAPHLQKYADDWDLMGAEALKHANLVTLTLQDAGKVRATNKYMRALGGVSGDDDSKSPIIGKRMKWKVKKGKAGTHDGIEGDYEMLFDRDPTEEDIDSVITAGFRLGVLRDGETGIDMLEGHTKEPTNVMGIPSREAFIAMLKEDHERELVVRQHILAAAEMRVLYRL
jgi:RecA/RadA recombinase